MKFAVVLLAVVAAASAQQYNPFAYNQAPYTPGQYNPGQYNPGQYNQYNSFQRKPYRPFVTSTPLPYRPFVSSTPAPVVSFAPPAPTPALPAPARVAVKSNSENANIVKYSNEINPDGSYAYFYETDNGIAAQEQGTPKNLGGNPPAVPDVAQGSFSYTSPEGIPIVISYVADENGFQPQGDSIPQPPPIPEQIARALEYIARAAPSKL